MSRTSDSQSQHYSPSLGTMRKQSISNGQLNDPPPMHRIHAETVRKHRDVRRLLRSVRHEEEKVRVMQARLDEILKEKDRREQDFQTSMRLLPSPDDITALKIRLQVAREGKQLSVDKISSADVYLTLATAGNHEKYRGDARQRRECIELKQSIISLKGEVSRLKRQLQELNGHVKKRKDKNSNVFRSLQTASGTVNNGVDYPNSSNGVAKLRKEKRLWEERVQEATAAWHEAAEREVKVSRLHESLKKKMAFLSHSSMTPMGPMRDKRNKSSGTESSADSFTHPLGSGKILAVSVSRQPDRELSLLSLSQSRENVSCKTPWSRDNDQLNKLVLVSSVNGSKAPTYSGEETLERQVKQLEVEYERTKRRVGELRGKKY